VLTYFRASEVYPFPGQSIKVTQATCVNVEAVANRLQRCINVTDRNLNFSKFDF